MLTVDPALRIWILLNSNNLAGTGTEIETRTLLISTKMSSKRWSLKIWSFKKVLLDFVKKMSHGEDPDSSLQDVSYGSEFNNFESATL